MYKLFYLYVGLVLDKKADRETVFFSDKLIATCFANELWLDVGSFRVIRPEPLLIIKISILNDRDREKTLKDVLDCLFVSNFSDIDFQLLRELLVKSKPSPNSIRIAESVLASNEMENELGSLRLDKNEITTMKASLLSLLSLMKS
jgi:hypothetical protein